MPDQNAPLELPPSQAILKMLTGMWITQAVSAAATLGIADQLKDGPKDVGQLAKATSSPADTLYRLLRALSSMGIFAETNDGRFILTPLAQCLRSDAPDSMRNAARMWGAPFFWRSWGELLHAVKTGGSGFAQAFGMTNPYEYFAEHPEDGEVFDGAMDDLSRNSGPLIAEAYDFGKFTKIIDAGGGHGALLISILRRYPRPHGIVFDLSRVVQGTRAAIAAAGFSDRCEAVAGDIFESVPSGADAYVMRSIIHGFEKERALVILGNIRRSIQPVGRLLLVDFVIPPGNSPSLSKFADIHMLVMAGGRERTPEEFRDLLGAAGFRLGGIYPTGSPQSIIEGIPT
jgi:O-methyltransferase/methyltransferase family protein